MTIEYPPGGWGGTPGGTEPRGKAMTSITHIAGTRLQVGNRVRQRCGWCGATLIDCDLERVAVPEGQDPAPGTWGAGELVRVDGCASFIVPFEDGAEVPEDACARLDDDVTA